MMKIKVLGSGSAGNSYLLQGDKETLIIEAGLPYKTILKGLNFNLNNVVGALVTHEHSDHSKAIRGLTNNSVDIYSSEGTFKSLNINNYHTKIISAGLQFKINDFNIMPFDVQHDANEPLGFLIQHEKLGKLLFITDTYFCKYRFKGLTHIMIECNYSRAILQTNIENGLDLAMSKRIIKSHFSLENVKEFLKANDLSQCENITLLHLSDSNSNAAQFKAEIEKLTGIPTYIGDKGLEIEL